MDPTDAPTPAPGPPPPVVGPGGQPPPPAMPPLRVGDPWGWWATLGFAAIIVAVFLFVQSIVVGVFLLVAVVQNPELDVAGYAQTLERNGLLWAVATLAAAPVCSGLLILFAHIRRGWTWQAYLGARSVTWPQLRLPLAALAILIVTMDLLLWATGQPIVPDIMIVVYRSSVIPSLLWVALLVAAPLLEEFFFRGFLFMRVWRSRLGGPGAVLITALAWAAIHVQYDWIGISAIFASGLVLGWARIRTGSVYAPMLLHALMNLVATAETAYLAR